MKRLHIVTPGSSYIVKDKKRLYELINTGNFLWFRTYYNKRKWWQFWKIKKPIAYEVMCIKDLEI